MRTQQRFLGHVKLLQIGFTFLVPANLGSPRQNQRGQ